MEGDVYTPLENYKDPGSGNYLAAKRHDRLQPGNNTGVGLGVPYNNAAARSLPR